MPLDIKLFRNNVTGMNGPRKRRFVGSVESGIRVVPHYRVGSLFTFEKRLSAYRLSVYFNVF